MCFIIIYGMFVLSAEKDEIENGKKDSKKSSENPAGPPSGRSGRQRVADDLDLPQDRLESEA